MHRYIANRMIQGALTGLLVSIVIFAILRIAPGDVAMMIALEMTGGEEDLVTEEQLAKIREDVGLNAPIYVQYLTWIGGWVTGDWGESMFSNEGIWENFLRKLPVTVELALLSIGLSTILGLPAGVLMALRKDTWIDYTLRIWSLSGLSIPNFWLATMLLVVGMYVFEWSPQIGFVPFFENPTGNMTQFFWPALIVGYSSMVTKARMMRSTMLEVLRQDYIRTAHAKGLSGDGGHLPARYEERLYPSYYRNRILHSRHHRRLRNYGAHLRNGRDRQHAGGRDEPEGLPGGAVPGAPLLHVDSYYQPACGPQLRLAGPTHKVRLAQHAEYRGSLGSRLAVQADFHLDRLKGTIRLAYSRLSGVDK